MYVFQKQTLQIFRAISLRSFLNFSFFEGSGFCGLLLKCRDTNFPGFLPDGLCHHNNTQQHLFLSLVGLPVCRSQRKAKKKKKALILQLEKGEMCENSLPFSCLGRGGSLLSL